MVTSTQARADFEEFVVARSDRLWRTAYLLSGDPDVAEHLLEQALARVRGRWLHLDSAPEAELRRLLVSASLRRLRPTGSRARARVDSADPWSRWLRLSPSQRAVVVLCEVDGVEAGEAADVLGCGEHAVRTRLAAALDRLGPVAVPDLVARADGVAAPRLGARLDGVDRAGAALGRARRGRTAAAVAMAAVGLLVAVVLVPPPTPDPPVGPDLDVIRPLTLVGLDLPSVVTDAGLSYDYARSEETRHGGPLLRMAVAPHHAPQLLAWAAAPAGSGAVVVSVDGVRRREVPTGRVHTGLVLLPGRPHLVVVRATDPVAATAVGVALYQRPDEDRG